MTAGDATERENVAQQWFELNPSLEYFGLRDECGNVGEHGSDNVRAGRMEEKTGMRQISVVEGLSASAWFEWDGCC